MDVGTICLLVFFLVFVIPIFFIDAKLSSIKDFFRASLIEYLGTNGMKFFKKASLRLKRFALIISLLIDLYFMIFFCLLFYFTLNNNFSTLYAIYYFGIIFLFIFFMLLAYYLVSKKFKKFDIPIKIDIKKLREKLLKMSNYFILPNQINNLTLAEIQRSFFIKEKINIGYFYDSAFYSIKKDHLIDNKFCNNLIQRNLFIFDNSINNSNSIKTVKYPIFTFNNFLPSLVAIFILSKKDKNEFYAVNQITQEKIYFDEYYNLWKKIFDEVIIFKK